MAHPDTDVVLVLTTLPADFDAATLSRTLVVERLAACVSVMAPMHSLYWWQGQVESADERQVVIKTTSGQASALEARLQALHPYDVPELLVLPVTGGGQIYLDWVRGETAVRGGGTALDGPR
jgi:periplasmic divalent cation tolerance protein